MTEEMHQRVMRACFRWLIPIARVLLKNGFGYREFEGACRSAFIHVASKEFGVRGRDTNISRVSAMTGIPRKEVQRLKQENDDHTREVTTKLSPLADLLHVWATSDEFQDENGAPAVLPTGSTGYGSFADLVRNCVGDVPPGAVKVELLRLGVTEQPRNNAIRLVRRSLIPPGSDERLVSAFSYGLKGLAETIAHNNSPETPKSNLRFERFVESRPLTEQEIATIRGIVRNRLKEVSEEFDDLLDPRPLLAPMKGGRRIGVGLYFTE